MFKSLRVLAVGSAVLAMVALGSLAQGQEAKPGGRGPGRFGPGFGGPGMSQSPAMLWGMLLQQEVVGKDLELSDSQKAELKEMAEKAMASMRGGMPDREAMAKLSDEERRARFDEMRKKMEARLAEGKAQIEKILTADQIERLRQIAVQVRGTMALDDKEVQDELGIKDDQKAKLREIRAAQMKKMFRPPGEQPQGGRERFQAMRKEFDAEILAVLTEEQKQKLEDMKGKKIEIDLSQMMRPGGNRRPQPKGN
jgi:Spy/CpxP family protein refolding chaperone